MKKTLQNSVERATAWERKTGAEGPPSEQENLEKVLPSARRLPRGAFRAASRLLGGPWPGATPYGTVTTARNAATGPRWVGWGERGGGCRVVAYAGMGVLVTTIFASPVLSAGAACIA